MTLDFQREIEVLVTTDRGPRSCFHVIAEGNKTWCPELEAMEVRFLEFVMSVGLHTPEGGVKEPLRLEWLHSKDPCERRPHLPGK